MPTSRRSQRGWALWVHREVAGGRRSLVPRGSAFYVRQHYTLMKTKEIFDLVRRVFGILVASFGAWFLIGGVVLLFDQRFLPGAFDLLFGFLLIRVGYHTNPVRAFR